MNGEKIYQSKRRVIQTRPRLGGALLLLALMLSGCVGARVVQPPRPMAAPPSETLDQKLPL